MGACSIVPLKEAHLTEVAGIHMRAFPGRALTCLGEQAVRRYYQILLDSEQFHLVVGVHDGERLLGYLFGGEIRGAMVSFLKRNFGYLLFQLLTHPNLLLKQIVRNRLRLAFAILKADKKRRRRKKSAKRQNKPTFTVLVIAVAPEVQCAGLGRLLMRHAEAVAHFQGYEQMRLSVDRTNTRAVQFYERLGWRRTPEINWRGNMVKPLVLKGAGIPEMKRQVQTG